MRDSGYLTTPNHVREGCRSSTDTIPSSSRSTRPMKISAWGRQLGSACCPEGGLLVSLRPHVILGCGHLAAGPAAKLGRFTDAEVNVWLVLRPARPQV